MTLLGVAAVLVTAGCASPAAAPTGTQAEATAAAVQFAGKTPPAAAQMICDAEIRGQIADGLALGSVPAPQPQWANHVYTCAYALPMGPLVLSVTVTPSDAAARTTLTSMRSRLPNAAAEAGLGQAAYSSATGIVVAAKDNMVLRVDPTGLPDDLGTVHEHRIDFARAIAAGVFNCWQGPG